MFYLNEFSEMFVQYDNEYKTGKKLADSLTETKMEVEKEREAWKKTDRDMGDIETDSDRDTE